MASDPPPGTIFVCGPTASGKSTLALELARELDGEVVNADAFQLHRGLEVLTAAPDAAELAGHPHHLYGILAPGDGCDAMRYRGMALPVLEDIARRGRRPIVTGGSGLYLKFLSHGPSPLPTGSPDLRASWADRPLASLVAELGELDPVEAARTDLKNRRYVTRALEICRLSGQRCSELRDRWESAAREKDRHLTGIYLQRERADLHQRIDRRSRRMLDEGAIDEVRRHPRLDSNLAKAIGYPEISSLLAGEIDRETCLERIIAATRQYAKRQETWFRREAWLRPLRWAPGAAPPTAAALALLA